MKKIILIASISIILISSCTTLHNFNHKKYFGFKRAGTEINSATLSTSGTQTETAIVLSETTTDNQEIISNSFTPDKKESVTTKSERLDSKLTTNLLSSNLPNGGKKSVSHSTISSLQKRIINKQLKKTASDGTKVKGKLWWVFMIVAFVGLLISLVASALLGTLLFLAGLAVGVIMLIMNMKSKHQNSGEDSNTTDKKNTDKPKKEKAEPKKKKRG